MKKSNFIDLYLRYYMVFKINFLIRMNYNTQQSYKKMLIRKPN